MYATSGFVIREVFGYLTTAAVEIIICCLLAKDCGRPPSKDHTEPFGDIMTTYGSKYEYICSEGYEASGDMETICQANTSWSEVSSICTGTKYFILALAF